MKKTIKNLKTSMRIYATSFAAIAIIALFPSCNPDDDVTNPDDNEKGTYVVASQGQFSNTTTNALLTATSLDSGTIGM